MKPTLFALAAFLTSTALAPAQVMARDIEPPPTSFEKACNAFIRTKGKKPEPARLKELFDFQWTHWMKTFPEWATYVGYPGQNGRWTDYSLQAIAVRKRETLCTLEMAASIDPRRLKGDDVLNHSLFWERAKLAVEGNRFPDELLPINQMGGVQIDIAQLFQNSPQRTEADYVDLVSRLRGAGLLLDQTLLLLEKGLAAKVTPPRITLRDVPNQVQAMITEDPMRSPLLAPFTEMPASIGNERAEALRADAIEAYSKTLRPRLQRLHAYLKDVYIPGARQTLGLRDLPSGEAWYAFRVKDGTTTDFSPRQIHEIGLKEVKRIRAEMEAVIRETGHKGSIESFEKKIRGRKEFFYSRPEELIDGYRALGKRVDPELVKLFGRFPRTPWGVEPIPPYQEKSAPGAHYVGGSLEQGRAGIFYANTYDLKSRPKWEMEALTLHEAVPGHHFQIALARELENQPEFRKHAELNAYIEGWALYAESLGPELGFYKDPYSRYGRLTSEMLRAARLVVDTGLHQLGWSREKAIQFMNDNVGGSEHDNITEVDRYIVWPGQALGYKIGELKIKELRDRAMNELGPRFDVRAFHDAVLGSGAVPLNVLERLIDNWIAKLKIP